MVAYKNLCFLLFLDSVGFSHSGHMAVLLALACLLALLRGFTVVPCSWDTVPCCTYMSSSFVHTRYLLRRCLSRASFAD